MLDIATLGASTRDADSNAPLIQAMVELGEGDHESFGEVAVYGALGVTAMPYPADNDGQAEGVAARGLGNASAAIIGVRDTRTADVAAELGPGETCVHATGPGFEARRFYKKQLIADIIGDDCAIVFDRENKSFTIDCFGLRLEISEEQGIVLTTGGATLQIKDSAIIADGTCMLGGRTGSPATAAAYAPGPVVGVSGATVPSQKVFIAPP